MALLPTLVLLATVAVPPGMYVALHTSSMSAGVVVVSLMNLLWLLIPGRATRGADKAIVFSLLASLAIIVSSIVGVVARTQFDDRRFLLSFALLVIMSAGAFSLARIANEIPGEIADRAAKNVFFVLLITGLASAFGWPIFTTENGFPISFFNEPSHFALSLAPFALYVAIRASNFRRVALMATTAAITIGAPSLTLIVVLSLVAVLTLPKRYLAIAAVSALLAVYLLPDERMADYMDALTYYTARIELSSYNENLSVLAFLQGWERAYLNLVGTNGLGVGFQQFGIIGDTGDIQIAIRQSHGDYSNLLDGGSVGAKLVGEFGVLGVVLLIIYVGAFAKNAYLLRRIAIGDVHGHACQDVFFRCCFTTYALDIFLRGGGGYFSPTAFLMIASMFWLGQCSIPSTDPARSRSPSPSP